MKRARFLIVAAAAVVLAMPACASDEITSSIELNLQGAYYLPNMEAYGATGFAPVTFSTLAGDPVLRDVGTGWGSAKAKAIVSDELVIPALRGAGPLFSGNNLAVKLSGELSPVSVNADLEATLTPIAFLKLNAGAAVGTGWSIGFIGLGLTPANGTSTTGFTQTPFGGLVWRAWVTGTFQFDLAALMPGDWNHVVVVASPTLQYWAFTAAADGQAWIWEADDGYDFNGFKLKGTYFLGYQMPLALNTVGLLFETEQYLGAVAERSTMASGGWGSDFMSLNFGPLFNFTLGPRSSLAVIVQFKTAQKWTDATTRNWYFETRANAGSYLYFNWLALSYTLGL